VDADQVLDAATGRLRRWRWILYPAVTVAAVAASFLPLVAGLPVFIGMLVTRIVVIRRPMRWLSATRKLTTRLTLSLLLALITLGTILVNAVLYLAGGLGQLATVFLSIAGLLVFSELSIRLVANRLRREGGSEGLDTWEWLLPAAVIGGFVVSAVFVVGVTALLLYLVLWMDIPGISDIAAFLLSTGGE